MFEQRGVRMPSKAVLITGAGAGLGLATTQALAAKGYRVHAGVRQAPPPQLDAPGVHPVTLDVTDEESVAAAAEQVAAAEPAGLHAVVNNAGVIVQGPQELLPAEEWQRQFDVNVFGPARVTRVFLPLLRAARGRVVNISAPTARVAFPFLGPLSASKAALESLSDAARVELAPWGIRVVVVEPGALQTEIFTKAAHAAQIALHGAGQQQLALYRRQLDALETASARQRLAPVEKTAQVVAQAVDAARPRRRYYGGPEARSVGLLAGLPAGLRERAVAGALGLPLRPDTTTPPVSA
jgi:NAD(P)-dependent dehydrogenase (short-subunit alcohol dehydrogenase family)